MVSRLEENLEWTSVCFCVGREGQAGWLLCMVSPRCQNLCPCIAGLACFCFKKTIDPRISQGVLQQGGS
jgi:hypothetical protein